MDETQPLLTSHTAPPQNHNVAVSEASASLGLVGFDPNGDAENPLQWSKAYKRGVVALLSFMAFTVTFTCISVVPVASHIIASLSGHDNPTSSILLVTIWEFGEAAGPLLIAPLSETYGRYPVYLLANLLFILGTLLSALSPSVPLLIFARFLTGFAVASNVLNPAIIGDIFPSEERGAGMSLILVAPLVGGAVGPAIAGAIAETWGWRSILWISAFVAILCEIFFLVLFRETYKVRILQRRAARLRKEKNDESIKCAWDIDGNGKEKKAWWVALKISIIRPVTVLRGSVVLQIMSFHGGLVFVLYYILATTLPGMLKDIYGFSPAMVGASFLSFSIGAICGIVACNLFLDRIYIHLSKSSGEGHFNPEFRLPFQIIGAAFLPAIVALYGWVPHARWHVSLLLLAVALIGFFMIMVMVPLSSYIVDAFGIYSASAMTMVLIARCLAGTLLPLAIPPLTEAVGLGYGFLILAAVCLVLIPLPVAVMRYGKSWRQKSAYTRDK